MPTLEAYLRSDFARNVIDHVIRAHVHDDGSVVFYIHPSGVNGDTLDFQVCGNRLVENPRVTRTPAGGTP